MDIYRWLESERGMLLPRVLLLPNISPISLRIVFFKVNVPKVLSAGRLVMVDSNAAD